MLLQPPRVEFGGVRILVIYNKRELPKEFGDVQPIVFGHFHKYFGQIINGRLWLNPGSCGKRSFDQEISFALVRIDGGALCVQKVVLPQICKPSTIVQLFTEIRQFAASGGITERVAYKEIL